MFLNQSAKLNGSYHGIRFARSRLSIRKDADVESVDAGVDEGTNVFEHLLLSRIGVEHAIKTEVLGQAS